MLSDTPYAELGLRPGASESEVKAAWRKLVSQWHPDRNDSASAVAKMQRINQAFEAIRLAAFGDGAAASHAPAATEPAPESERDEPASDRPRRTLHRKLKLTLEEAAMGCTKELRGKITEGCSTCEGVGYRVLGGACSGCAGAGSVRQRAWYGFYGAASECEACRGDGMAKLACTACDGAGKLGTRPYKVGVRIPPGVRHGDLLHVDAQRACAGHPGAQIELHVEVAPHAFFELGDDGSVRCEVPVDGFAWIANRAIEVPTLAGLQTLKIKREQITYRLSGQGFPVVRRGARGDLWVTVVPRFPERFSTDQEILLDQLVATSSSPDGQSADPRVEAWKQTLGAWDRGLRRRDGAAAGG